MKLMKEKAEQLLQRCEVVVITSVNEEGYPRRCLTNLPGMKKSFFYNRAGQFHPYICT